MSSLELARITHKFGDPSQWSNYDIGDYAYDFAQEIRSEQNWRGKYYKTPPNKLQTSISRFLNSYRGSVITGGLGSITFSSMFIASSGVDLMASIGMAGLIASMLLGAGGCFKEMVIKDRLADYIRTKMLQEKDAAEKAKKSEDLTPILKLLNEAPEPHWADTFYSHKGATAIRQIDGIKKSINFLIKNPEWKSSAETSYAVVSLVTGEVKDNITLLYRYLDDDGFEAFKLQPKQTQKATLNMMLENLTLLNTELSKIVSSLHGQYHRDLEVSNIFLRNKVGSKSRLVLERK